MIQTSIDRLRYASPKFWRGVVVCSAFFISFVCAMQAIARDNGQWEGSDPAIAEWFRTLMQPDNPQLSCCGKADAYWADIVLTENGKLIAVITDDRPDAPLGRHHVPVGTKIEVPPHKIKWDRGNPTGHIVIFLSINNDVYCYVQNGDV